MGNGDELSNGEASTGVGVSVALAELAPGLANTPPTGVGVASDGVKVGDGVNVGVTVSVGGTGDGVSVAVGVGDG